MKPLIAKIFTENCSPDLIPGREIDSAKELQEELSRLRAMHMAFKSAGSKDHLNILERTFTADPTHGNLDALEKGLIRFEMADKMARIRGALVPIIEKFYLAEYLPWIQRISAPPMQAISDHLNKVRRAEEARVLKETGQPLKQYSDIVSAIQTEQNDILSNFALLRNPGAGRSVAGVNIWLGLFGYSLDSKNPSWASKK